MDDEKKIGPPVSGDVRAALDKEFLYSYDLQGRDVTVEIERVAQGTLVGMQGKKAKKPVVFFKNKSKPLALNITNIKTIAQLYGSYKAEDWVGKKITIYPTTTSFGGDTRDCIRVRNVIPRDGRQQSAAPPKEESEDDRNRRLAAPGPGEMP